MTTAGPLQERLVALRRDLHRHPELGWDVDRTARRIIEELSTLGIDARHVAGTAVVADLPGAGSGPAVALRADMDALPIEETTGLEFRSTNPGVMHACGHDGHAAVLVGAGAILAQQPLPHPVRLIFQPAEETAEGAQRLIAEGVLDGVGSIFGLHIDLGFAVGTIAVPDGPVNASTDEFTIRLIGTGGHAARPHEAVDPIAVAGLLISGLQTIVARRVPPSEPAVVTIGKVEAGTAPNVLAESALLEGTVRAASPEVRTLLIDSVRDLAVATAAAHRIPCTFALTAGTPPVVNSPAAVAAARAAASDVVGPAGLSTEPLGNMGGEDFGFYLERVSGCFARLGARIEDGRMRRAHAGTFDFDERALAIGARYLAAVAARGLPPGS